MLITKSILAFIPHYDWFLCRSWRSKWVNIYRQQDPPHLALCLFRVKVWTKVLGISLIKHPAQKLISYLAFIICELECVYHDVCSCWRMEWIWLKCHPYHAASFGFFERICINKLFMVLLSSWVFHCRSCVYSHLGLPLLSPTNVNGLCGAKQAVRRHYLDSYLLQDQRLDP